MEGAGEVPHYTDTNRQTDGWTHRQCFWGWARSGSLGLGLALWGCWAVVKIKWDKVGQRVRTGSSGWAVWVGLVCVVMKPLGRIRVRGEG